MGVFVGLAQALHRRAAHDALPGLVAAEHLRRPQQLGVDLLPSPDGGPEAAYARRVLHEIARDPAMVVYLDNAQNRVVLAHELTHALQDQHFGLKQLPLDQIKLDRSLARTLVVEARRADPDSFAPLYEDLLAAGGTRTYVEALKPFGLNPREKAFWAAGMAQLERLVDEFEALVA